MYNICIYKKGVMKLSKKDKQFERLLKQKTLSSEEAIRLLMIDGWREHRDNPQKGSHKQFVHPSKKGKVTVPMGRKVLTEDTKNDILSQAGLTGD